MKAAACALALCLLPAVAGAATFHDASGACQITIPDGWTTRGAGAGARAMSPTPGFYARVRVARDVNEVRTQILAQGWTVLSDTPTRLLGTAQVSAGGVTNKLYWAVSKTQPACWATVTFPAGPLDAQARAIAESVRP